MASYLVMQLYGPLAAWGEQAVGEVRRSAAHPSKSAVLGLCAAARGIRRDDEQAHQRLAEGLKFGAKVLVPGAFLKDYHTTQAPPQSKKTKHLYTRRDELREAKLGTLLSSREYRQDALALAVLWQTDGAWQILDELFESLHTPVFHLYLGRKACPVALPLNPRIIEATSLEAALTEYPAPLLDEDQPLTSRLPFSEQPATLYWEACEHSGMPEDSHDFRVPRYDQPLSRKRWQFTSRDEYVRLGSGNEA